MNELSKALRCVVMRNGIELWLENDKAGNLQQILLDITAHKFVKFGERTINTADITGIYLPEDMDLMTRRKNGQWQCKTGNWHAKGEQCDCSRRETTNWTKLRLEGKDLPL